MDHCFLDYKKSKVHALRFGHGDQLLIALHGFADTAALFTVLQKSLESKYTIYAIDLPFHGKTIWDKQYYDRADISAIFQLILDKENKERFDLMGFSLGGRIVQKMLFEWQDQIDQVHLIAPYGLSFNASWVPQWIKALLYRMLHQPKWMISLASLLNRWKLLKPFHYKFVQYHIANKMNRDRLFYTWQSLHYFKLQPKKVKVLLAKSSMKVDLYFGAKDKVIPVSQGQQLSEGLAHVDLHILDTGHRLVGEELANFLEKEIEK